jgi:hypothetical protein
MANSAPRVQVHRGAELAVSVRDLFGLAVPDQVRRARLKPAR